MKWRVGRTLGRTLYIQVEPEPSKFDVFVGIMDDPDLAQEVVDAMNKRAVGSFNFQHGIQGK